MSRLPSIPLQPVAAPTNQFAPPEVRRKDTASKAAELAQALSFASSRLERVANNWFESHVQGSQMRAQRDAMQHRFENMKQFKEAVKKGEIAESNNPWYMVSLKQSVARTEVERAAREVAHEFAQSDLRHSDDLDAVSAFFNEGFNSRLGLGERDVWEAEVMHPALQEYGNRMLAEHVNRRTHEREVETEAIVGDELSAMFEGTSGAERQGQVAAYMAEKGKVMHWPKLNAMYKQRAAEYARSIGDAEAYRELLRSVKTPGGTLGDNIDAEVDRLHDQIMQDELREMEMERRRHDLSIEKFSRDLVERIHQENGNLEELQFDSQYLQGLTHEQQMSVLNVVAQRNNLRTNIESQQHQRSVEEIRQGLYIDLVNGELDPEFRVSALEMMAGMGMPGFQAIHSFTELENFYRPDPFRKGISDPEAIKTLATADHITIDDVYAHKSELTQYDFNDFLKRAIVQQSNSPDLLQADRVLTDVSRNLSEQITFARTQEAFELYGTEESIPQFARHEIEQAGNEAISLLRDEYRAWLSTDEGRNASPQLHSEKIRELADDIAKRRQAPTVDEWRKAVQQTAAQRAAEATVKLDTTEQQPAGDVAPLGGPDAVLAQVRRVDREEMKQVFNAPVQSNTPISLPALFELGDPEWGQASLNRLFTARQGGDSKAELTAWMDAVQERQTIGEILADGGIAEFNALHSKLKAEAETGKPISVHDKANYINFISRIRWYSYLSRYGGYTPSEVKEMMQSDPKAWMKVPMFANEDDLFNRGPQVSQELGLDEPQQAILKEAQRKLLELQRDIRPGDPLPINMKTTRVASAPTTTKQSADVAFNYTPGMQ